MRVSHLMLLAATAGVVLLAGPVSAQTPTEGPKPGLWEMKASAPGMPQATAVKVCVGAPAPGANPFAPPATPGTNCARNNVSKTPSGITFDTECQAGGMTVATKGEVSGDLASAYKTTMTTKMTGPNIPPAAQRETRAVVDAKYLGACPAGMAPGTAQPG